MHDALSELTPYELLQFQGENEVLTIDRLIKLLYSFYVNDLLPYEPFNNVDCIKILKNLERMHRTIVLSHVAVGFTTTYDEEVFHKPIRTNSTDIVGNLYNKFYNDACKKYKYIIAEEDCLMLWLECSICHKDLNYRMEVAFACKTSGVLTCGDCFG